MALTPGRRLGPCEILSAFGAGGMAEVYRTTNTKGQVAVKIPPQALGDADRLARVERDVKTPLLNPPRVAERAP